MSVGIAIGVELLLTALATLILTGGKLRRGVGLLCGYLPLGVPFFIGQKAPLLAFFAALFAVLTAIRATDLYSEQAPWSFPRRLWHVVAGFDTRLARPMPPLVDRRLLAEAAAWGVVAGLVLVAAWTLCRRLDGWPRYVVRWAAFAAFAVSMFEVVTRGPVAIYAGLGVAVPVIHNRPYLSRSVGEFWGARWNMVIGRWLRHTFYAPLARRGAPRAGIVAAFLASALLHAYLVLPFARWPWAVLTCVFFLVQAVLMTVERAMRVRRWAPAAARVWTLGTLLLVSPMLSEPALQCVDPTPVAWPSGGRIRAARERLTPAPLACRLP